MHEWMRYLLCELKFAQSFVTSVEQGVVIATSFSTFFHCKLLIVSFCLVLFQQASYKHAVAYGDEVPSLKVTCQRSCWCVQVRTMNFLFVWPRWATALLTLWYLLIFAAVCLTALEQLKELQRKVPQLLLKEKKQKKKNLFGYCKSWKVSSLWLKPPFM